MAGREYTDNSSDLSELLEIDPDSDLSDVGESSCDWRDVSPVQSRPTSQENMLTNQPMNDIPTVDFLDLPSDDESSLGDSSASSSDYNPNIAELETSDSDEFLESDLATNIPPPPCFTPIDFTTPGPSIQPQIPPPVISPQQPWVRVYVNEPLNDIRTKFSVTNSGPRNAPNSTNPLDFLYLFMTTAVWALMVSETNKNARAVLRQRTEENSILPNSRISKWVEVTVEEMKIFWAILINMGLTSRKNLTRYWSTKANQFIPFYSKTMSLRRFQLIMSMFHLSSEQREDGGPWYQVRKFVKMMNDSFKKHFVAGQEICIDESMIGMKNRCAFIQYMPKKRHARFGIKKFELCDSATAYVLHVSMYSGRDFLSGSSDPFTYKVVKHMMEQTGYLNKGYHLFTDNFYTKIPLSQFLLSRNTYLTGTINQTSKGLSKILVQEKLSEVDRTAYFRKKETLLVKYQSKPTKKPVIVMSTASYACDIEVTSTSGRTETKPVMIHKYNQYMGGVDLKDKSIYHVTCTRPCKKYWRKIVYNFVDMAIFNAWVLYKAQNPKHRKRGDFMEDLVDKLISDGSPAQISRPFTRQTLLPTPTTPLSTSTHKLEKISRKNMRICVVCRKDGKCSRVRYWCPSCKSGVHPNCFSRLHGNISTETSTPSLHKLTQLKSASKLCGVCKEEKGVKSRVSFWCPPCNVGVHQKCFSSLKH